MISAIRQCLIMRVKALQIYLENRCHLKQVHRFLRPILDGNSPESYGETHSLKEQISWLSLPLVTGQNQTQTDHQIRLTEPPASGAPFFQLLQAAVVRIANDTMDRHSRDSHPIDDLQLCRCLPCVLNQARYDARAASPLIVLPQR